MHICQDINHSTYCTRYVIQRSIRRALPREELEKKYVVEACLKEANSMLSSFLTEERRVKSIHIVM